MPIAYAERLVRGRHVSTIAAIFIGVLLTQGTNNGESLFHLMVAAVIMDNCSIDHTQDVVSLIKEIIVQLLFISYHCTPGPKPN